MNAINLKKHMTITNRSILVLSLATIAGLFTGCGAPESNTPAPVVYRAPRSVLMFDRNRPAYNPTEFGRNPWPATTNGYETVERSVTTELYQDNFGNAFNDRSTPRRIIRGFKQSTRLR